MHTNLYSQISMHPFRKAQKSITKFNSVNELNESQKDVDKLAEDVDEVARDCEMDSDMVRRTMFYEKTTSSASFFTFHWSRHR